MIDAAQLIRSARRLAGRSQRELGAVAGTSHSTLATYERGGKVPTVTTLDRILRAAGFEAKVALVARRDEPLTDRMARGQELVDALELADAFPPRRADALTAPRFGWKA